MVCAAAATIPACTSTQSPRISESSEGELSGTVYSATAPPFQRWVIAADDGLVYDISAGDDAMRTIEKNDRKIMVLRGRIVKSREGRYIRVRTYRAVE